MRNFNRIIGFISVSFVLLFIAKINKSELYTAYFRTIADVEIRNSHALHMEGVFHAAAADLAGEQPVEHIHGVGDLAPSAFMPKPQAPSKADAPAALPAIPHIAKPCIPQTSPRAPDFRA